MSYPLKGFNPMDREPATCKCGAQAARAEMATNPNNPQCHLCRMIAGENPGMSDLDVSRAGRKRWLDIMARRPATGDKPLAEAA